MDNNNKETSFEELQVWLDNGKKNSFLSVKTPYEKIKSPSLYYPGLDESYDVLGSYQDINGIALNTGQLQHEELIIELQGAQPLEISLVYTAREKFSDGFGNHWALSEISRFEQLNDNLYRLYLSNGRKFDFSYDQDNDKFTDEANLGITVQKHKNNSFTLINRFGEKDSYQAGKIIQRETINGRIIRFDYDEQNRLLQIKNKSSKLDLSYGSNGLVKLIKDNGGRTWNFNYDDNQSLIEINRGDKDIRLFGYIRHTEDDNTHSYLLTHIKQNSQKIFAAIYSSQGLVTNHTYETVTYTYHYNDDGSVNRQNPDNTSQTFYLDQYNSINLITYCDQTRAYSSWNQATKELIQVDPSNAKTTFSYDKLHRLTKHIDHNGLQTKQTFTGKNQKPATLSSHKGSNYFQYDKNYNITYSKDEKGREEYFEYDALGNLIKLTDTTGYKQYIDYTSSGLPSCIKDSSNTLLKIEYDIYGRQIKTTDAEDRHSNIEYNNKNQISHVHESRGTTRYQYTANGLLTAIIDPAEQVREYYYTGDGEILREEKPEGTKHYHWKDNQLTSVQNVDGTYTHYKYTSTGKIAEENINGHITRYEHNDDDQIIKVSTQDSTVEFAYTASGQIESEIQNGLVVERSYAKKRLVNMQFLDNEITYKRDKQGLLESLILNDEEKIKLTFNSNDILTKREYPNQQKEEFEFDQTGSIKNIVTANQQLQYKTDKSGLITQKNDVNYRYDPMGQLVQVGSIRFKYDVLGNLKNNNSVYEIGTNKLLENNDYLFSYDTNGNLIQKTHKASRTFQQYKYDQRHQLLSVTGEVASSAGKEIRDLSFTYDAIGRRSSKTVNGIAKHYLYDQHDLIAILDDNKECIATILYDQQAVDMPLSISSKNGTFYYHRDHQGSIIALTDNNGNVVESFIYDQHFGKILKHEKIIETHNPFAYTGREFDAPDLYYYRARYYDPETIRFLTLDPSEFLSGDLNLYRYVANDPVNSIDPTGLSKGPCAKLEKLKALKRKILKAGKALFKRVGKSLKKRVITTLGSLAGGPAAIVVGAANLVLTGWDAWKARNEIGDLFDAAKEGYDMVASGDFDAGELATELADTLKAELMGSGGAAAGGLAAKLAASCKKKKKNAGKGDEKEGKKKQDDCPKCKGAKGTNPVIFTGAKILGDTPDLDFTINAPMPLIWQRNYNSSNPKVGLLGQGWRLLSDSHLNIFIDRVFFSEPNGREIEFNAIDVGESSRWVTEQLTLSRPESERYILKTGDGSTLIFTPSSDSNKYVLSRIEDLNGNGLSYHYNYYKQKNNDDDRLTHIETDDKRVFALKYYALNDANMRLASIEEWVWKEGQDRKTEPNFETLVSYQYSDQGDLIEVRNQIGRITRQFEYQNHLMVAHKIPNGTENFYEYNGSNASAKVIRNWDNQSKDIALHYYRDHTKVVDHSGRQTVYHFDEDEYLTGTTDALGQLLTKKLDKDGLPQEIINEAGQVKKLAYDTRGNPILITDVDGTTIQVTYHDDFNLPVEIIDDLGNTTTFEYDDRGNLSKEISADGAVTKYTYDNRGLPIIITDPKGGTNTLEYDSAGNLLKRTDCSKQNTYYQYDRHSNLTEIKDALGQRTRYFYDEEHRLTTIRYPDNTQERFNYNTQGQLIQYTDAKGNQTHYELDLEGKPTKRRNALGGELEYRYDAHSRLTHLINENKAEYKFAYDPLDRLIYEQGVDGLTTGYQYDPVGNVTQKQENETGKTQRITQFLRDKAGRLEEKFISLGDQYARTRYQYDELGQLTQARNEHSRVDLTYDVMGRLKEETTSSDIGKHTLSHEYDHLGNRLKTQLPDGRNLNWLYYGSGHLHQINLDGQMISDYERDVLHREINRTQGVLQQSTNYDPLGRILQQRAQLKSQQSQRQTQRQTQSNNPSLKSGGVSFNQSPTPVSITRNYQYDKSGELSQINDSRHGITRYQYDALGRITETHAANQSLNERFAFDPAHNLISDEDQQQGKALKDNKLNEYQNKRYQYDSFGNMTEKLTKQSKMRFSYDAEHQMQTAEVYKNGVEQQYQYIYDPFGRRISKADAFNATHFIWDGNRLLTELRGKQSKTFVYEQDGFVPIAQVTQDNEINHYHTDHLGTPRELTDQEGEITWEATYQTWGNTVKVVYQEVVDDDELAPAVQPLRFQGQYFDEETGLHYNRFRYYDPDVGRFVTQDPIGLYGGDNLYQYSPNPVGWIDPLGLNCSEDAKKLRENMKKDGIKEPNYDNSAHHIVASNDTNSNMVAAREHLDKHGVGKNGSSNGVFLPTNTAVKEGAGTKALAHSRVHRNKYKKMVKDRITSLSSKEDIEKELKKIGSELLDGSCDIF